MDYKKFIPWIVACALFMETLDTTIISTAIPTMAASFMINPIALKFALTSYLISLAIFVPISGFIADRFGAKQIFIFALIIFTISSILCGISANLWELVIYRVMQGFGGAIMMPVGRLILLKIFTKQEMISVTNYVTVPALFGPMLGPLAGGILTTYISWHWIFLVNAPIGLIGIIIALKYIPNLEKNTEQKFDKFGFILFATGLAGLSFVLNTSYENLLSYQQILYITILSLVAIVLYFINHRLKTIPLFNFTIFKIRTFSVTVMGSFFSRVGMGGVPFLLPLLFQLGFKYSPLASGLLIAPMALGMITMKFMFKRILFRFGFKHALILNTALLGLSITSFAILRYNSNLLLIITLVFINGLLSSLQFSCMNNLTYIDIDKNLLSQSTSIGSSIQQLSMSLGVSFTAICLKTFLNHYHLTYFNTQSFSYTFLVLGIFTIITTLIFTVLDKNDGLLIWQKTNK